jgi:murein L,D-transpeptidase YafK
MSKGRARYTECDIVRILKASAKAHVGVRVKIDIDGSIMIATRKSNEQHADAHINEWDEVFDNGDDQASVR